MDRKQETPHSLSINCESTVADLAAIEATLRSAGTFDFPTLPNGLFPAAHVAADTEYTGYGNVWVRDNVFVAYAHWVVGENARAISAARALLEHFRKQPEHFDRIIAGTVDGSDPMERPHIRFDGAHMQLLNQRWPHAQNDALGYFLWFCCRLIDANALTLGPEEAATLTRFPDFFRAIRYWEDEDSGHWEETRKVNASSIGVVVAALEEYRKVLPLIRDVSNRNAIVTVDELPDLIAKGRSALDTILPFECRQPVEWSRETDAALLFLVYPLEIVTDDTGDEIVRNVVEHLQGDLGIKRYLGDSFWCPDYKKKLGEGERTADWSERLDSRDSMAEYGREAQWCIFDPIVSAIYGRRFQRDGKIADFRVQTEYLNRALAGLTASFQCPELYYLEDEQWRPNDSTPLLWTQANLLVALKLMHESLALRASGRHPSLDT